MVYLFSSNYYGLYAQDVLDACCYPEGHVMRLRYSERYVPDSVRRAPALMLGQKGLFVFADTDGSSAENVESKVEGQGATGSSKPDFRFYPIREIEIVDIRLMADVLLVDARLGDFLNYGPETDETKERDWDKGIKRLPNRPCPPGSSNEGYFFYTINEQGLGYSTREKRNQVAWRSVIERINRSSLKKAVTFRVLGFYRVGDWKDRLAALFGRLASRFAKVVYREEGWREGVAEFLASFERTAESKIVPDVKGADCTYRFGMNQLVLMKLLFYRSRSAPQVKSTLSLLFDQQAFASVSKSRIGIHFRYNEERVFLPCRRLTDPILSVVTLVQEGCEQLAGEAPQPTFVIQVRPYKTFLFMTLALFGLGLFFLNLSPQDFTGTIFEPYTWLTRFSKVFGTLFVICASWQYLRKFPLK